MVNGEHDEWFTKLGDSVENITKMPRPRYIKSHLPWDLLPKQLFEKKPKVKIIHYARDIMMFFFLEYFDILQIIYVTRNPKDTCVSFYHYCKLFHGMKGDFQEFAELMLQDSSTLNDKILIYNKYYFLFKNFMTKNQLN